MSEKQGTYDFGSIEPKWQRHWEENQTFKASDCDASRPKYYVLDMFPYPSGQGLHVGHPEGYTASDIVARYKRMKGFNVLHPMGWDAFGLPAEQYAIDTGTHPSVTTGKNINTFRRQIKMLGFSYDWDREVDTTDPAYFKWTQWIFLKLFNSYYDPSWGKASDISLLEDALAEKPQRRSEWESSKFLVSWHEAAQAAGGDPQTRQALVRKTVSDLRLAYENWVPVWWCEGCKAVLANEEVKDGKCDRKGHQNVVRRPMRQWLLRITAYADRLLEDLQLVTWSESIKEMQRNWIGRSEGAEVDFEIAEGPAAGQKLHVFTTRPDTLFGATYMVLSPEHPLVESITTSQQREAIQAYRTEAARKSELERTSLDKEKTGVFTGNHAINPVNREKIPIWIADYVLATYGTGAIMAVPAHDTRDYEFAQKFNLPVIQVVQPPDPKTDWKGFVDDGTSVNSTGPEVSITGLPTREAKTKITAWLSEKGLGCKAINFKLRDWLFSRQRYWGEPIPVVHCEKCGVVPFPESALPLPLPEVTDYTPPVTGEPPLAKATDWLNATCPRCGGPARRETNTMPQWAGSCWYYLRYIDPKNAQQGWDPARERYWMPVDLYIGGAEHAVLHLLYSRFWHKFLFDRGYVSTAEPFTRLINQGMILGEDGQKMSKSRGNVVNPDHVIAEFGADSMRLYEMFMGPLEAMKPWSMQGVQGVYRFLQKAWRVVVDEETGELDPAVREAQEDEETLRLLHQTIRKVGRDVETFGFNTAISAMMIFANHLARQEVRPKSVVESFILILAPFAPHVAEELWQRLGHDRSLACEPWPQYDEELTREKQLELAVQVNGKVKDRIVVVAEADDESVKTVALASEKVVAALGGKVPKKVLVVKGRLVNIVV
ncbi:MAG TPA: leucine--tRNA ligase [Sedimentisphaerales bacterium]|nr:leucine--tRNA ligase [Sedimentisphaerales bacterium]